MGRPLAVLGGDMPAMEPVFLGPMCRRAGRLFEGDVPAVMPALFFIQVWQEAGEQAQQGKEGANMEDVVDAGLVGQVAEHGRADAAHSEGQAEEESRDEAYLPRHQFLGIDQDGGEGGCEDQTDAHGEDACPKEVGIGE